MKGLCTSYTVLSLSRVGECACSRLISARLIPHWQQAPGSPESNNKTMMMMPRGLVCSGSATGKLGSFCSELGSSYEDGIGYDVEDLAIEVLVADARSATSQQRVLARL